MVSQIELQTPSPDFSTMLVFSPMDLPNIFQTLITDFRPALRNTEPANALYMLTRFACLNCDDNWVEDLIIGATDAIEDVFFVSCCTSRRKHVVVLSNRISESCGGSHLPNILAVQHHHLATSYALRQSDQPDVRNPRFSVANRGNPELCLWCVPCFLVNRTSNITCVPVFVIRFAERRIDQLLDAAMLDYSPASSEFDSIQFEGEWSFLRSFGSKKKANGTSSSSTPRGGAPMSPTQVSRPSSPQPPTSPQSTRAFASLRQTFSRNRGGSTAAQLQSLFDSQQSQPTSLKDVVSFITALHTLLTMSGINPALIVQFWSQVMYWTACELYRTIDPPLLLMECQPRFLIVFLRERSICAGRSSAYIILDYSMSISFLYRSRAVQISMNLSVIEEWIGNMELPKNIGSHFGPVHDLLMWLQVCPTLIYGSGRVLMHVIVLVVYH